ncbi:MAG: hypothetical protein BWY74_03996 [Firmicutes bacterium ADurb.Bin419]|nr:MAG: hypothetical protein BWY74_03996 [Firmicutes bacterium ADurb.Bin419]
MVLVDNYMSDTKRYFPKELEKWRKNFRYWCCPWKRKIKDEMREKRKVMKSKDVGDGKDYNKRASDEWNFN